MTIMLITHNLGVVAEMCDTWWSCTWGAWWRRVRWTPSSTTPSTRTPRRCCAPSPASIRTARAELPTITGSIPHPYNRPAGCPFHPRCPDFMPGTCDKAEPGLTVVGDGQAVSCFLYERT